MNVEETWRTIDAQRFALTDQLAELSADEWRHPSLCDGWTVRDVAAHMSLNHTTIPAAIVEAVRYRGNIDRLIHGTAVRRAAQPTDVIVAGIRAMAGSRRHAPFVTYHEALIDVLVHSQDIMIPLGRQHHMPAEAAADAADRVFSIGYFKPKKKLGGFRFKATDIDWSTGSGASVEGPMDAILLVSTGRLAALPRLSGDGAAELNSRLTAMASSGTH